MARVAFKAFTLALSLFVCGGCDFGRDFTALNSEQSYKFGFNGFEKRLNLGTQKPFVLVFFTKNCGVCKAQIRILNALKTPENSDFTAENNALKIKNSDLKTAQIDFFIVLNDAANKAEAMLYAQKHDIKFPLFYEKRASEFLSKAVGGIYGVPVMVLFDKQGIQRRLFIGLTPQSVLEKGLLALL